MMNDGSDGTQSGLNAAVQPPSTPSADDVYNYFVDHRADANFQQEAKDAMQQYGLSQDQVSDLLSQHQLGGGIAAQTFGALMNGTYGQPAPTVQAPANPAPSQQALNDLQMFLNVWGFDPWSAGSTFLQKPVETQFDDKATYQRYLDAYNAQTYNLRQQANQNAPLMTREQFIQKYALGPGGTFVADDKGGNAASEVAGQDVAKYYDTYLGPNAQVTQVGGGDGGTEHAINWGGGKDRVTGAPIALNAWTNVNPHPESTAKSAGDALSDIAKPAALIAALYFGGGALAGLGSGAAAGAAAAPASGLAGSLGMNAGLGATALNTGALNAGMTLLRGGNIGDAAKSGLIGAALSPVGTLAGNAANSALSGMDLSPAVSKAVGTVAGNTALGGVQGALTGRGVGAGLQSGLVNGLVNAAGNYVGDSVKSDLGSTAGQLANVATRATLNGRPITAQQLTGIMADAAVGKFTSLQGLDPDTVRLVLNAAVSKNPALSVAANAYGRAVMGQPQKKATRGVVKRKFDDGGDVGWSLNLDGSDPSAALDVYPTVMQGEPTYTESPGMSADPIPYRPAIDSNAADTGQTYDKAYQDYLKQVEIAEFIQQYENDPNQTQAETKRLINMANDPTTYGLGNISPGSDVATFVDTNAPASGGGTDGSGSGKPLSVSEILKLLAATAAVGAAANGGNTGGGGSGTGNGAVDLRSGTASSMDPRDYQYAFDPHTGTYSLLGSPSADVMHGATGVDMYGDNKAAHIPAAAQGGAIHKSGLHAAATQPRFVQGPGDGLSDSVPVKMDDGGPGRLADGEFVIPADVVSGLGNGSSQAGAKILYKMMDNIRQRAHGHTKQTRPVNPNKVLPA